jgi:predicted ATPase
MGIVVTLKYRVKLRWRRVSKELNNCFWSSPCCLVNCCLRAEKSNSSRPKRKPNPQFLDRGIPDILAYMHYIGDSYPAFFEEASTEHRYDKVFILPPWEAIYVSDEARYENFEQAQLIYRHLQETYRHFGYSPMEVPVGPVADRVAFILNAL